MSKNKIGIKFQGFAEMAEKLDSLGGSLKDTTEEALIKSKDIVTANLQKATKKSNYPAQGKYSTGLTEKSIDTSKNVEWNGTMGQISVGYDFDKSGMRTIYLMYGTPRMRPAAGMYDAIYGRKTQSDIRKTQKEIFADAIKKEMG